MASEVTRRDRKRRRGVSYTGSVGEFTRQVLDQYNIRSDVHAHQLITDWEDIVGPRVAARTTPMNVGAAISDGVLSVRVANSAWLHELSFIKEQLLGCINDFVGNADNPRPIRELRFFHGRAPKGRNDELQLARAQQHRVKPPSRPLPPPATEQKLEQIRRETAEVDDLELRDAIIEARRLLDI